MPNLNDAKLPYSDAEIVQEFLNGNNILAVSLWSKRRIEEVERLIRERLRATEQSFDAPQRLARALDLIEMYDKDGWDQDGAIDDVRDAIKGVCPGCGLSEKNCGKPDFCCGSCRALIVQTPKQAFDDSPERALYREKLLERAARRMEKVGGAYYAEDVAEMLRQLAQGIMPKCLEPK